jgi:hypothetical protein
MDDFSKIDREYAGLHDIVSAAAYLGNPEAVCFAGHWLSSKMPMIISKVLGLGPRDNEVDVRRIYKT